MDFSNSDISMSEMERLARPRTELCQGIASAFANFATYLENTVMTKLPTKLETVKDVNDFVIRFKQILRNHVPAYMVFKLRLGTVEFDARQEYVELLQTEDSGWEFGIEIYVEWAPFEFTISIEYEGDVNISPAMKVDDTTEWRLHSDHLTVKTSPQKDISERVKSVAEAVKVFSLAREMSAAGEFEWFPKPKKIVNWDPVQHYVDDLFSPI